MQRPAYTMTIDFGLGRAAARYPSHGYVTINADSRHDRARRALATPPGSEN
jgi:hypothetical protein